MTATAVIGPGSNRPRRIAAKLRADDGVGLVELLIALLVLNIGIFATLAAFTGGALALRRASHVSTASAIADNYMECFRDVSYDNITWPLDPATVAAGSMCATSLTPNTSYATVTGPDGRPYNVTATITAGDQTSSVTTTTPTYSGSSAVKVVQLTVTDPADSHGPLVTSSSTFSQCAQDMSQQTCQS